MIGVTKGITADLARVKPDKQSGYEIHGVGNPLITRLPFLRLMAVASHANGGLWLWRFLPVARFYTFGKLCNTKTAPAGYYRPRLPAASSGHRRSGLDQGRDK